MNQNNTEVLIIGYGNTLRGDDGVGVRVAETIAQLEWEGVRSLWVHQLTPELAEDISQAKMVIFVDAVVSEALEIRAIEAVEEGGKVGHYQDPRSLLLLTKAVYGAIPLAWWVLIPGVNFEFGEELSPITQGYMKDAIEQIKKLL